MDQSEMADESFERLWSSLSTDKTRLRSLNEKDKNELKAVMKSIFLTSLAAHVGDGPDEINVNVQGVAQEDIESTVRSVLREELGDILKAVTELRDRPSQQVVVQGSAERRLEEEKSVVELHGSMFDSDMKTNLDDIDVSKGEVGDVKGSLDALRKLRNTGSDADDR